MPRLIHKETGEPLATDLTAGELEHLSTFGVEFEADEADGQGIGAGGSSPGDDEVIDEILEDDSAGSGGDGDGLDLDAETELDEMDQADDVRSAAEWFDLDPDDDYETADEQFVEQYEELRRRVAESQTDMGERLAERTERMRNISPTRYDHHSEIQAALRKTGLDREIEKAFRKLVTRDHEYAAPSGKKVHLRNATRRFAGDTTVTDLYTRKRRAETGDRCVGVALDLSGSMNGFNAKVALGALAIATNAVGDDLCAMGFQNNGGPRTPLITRPNETFEWEQLDAVSAGGGTPTADGVYDMTALLGESAKPEKVMIVVTDGKPNQRIRSEINVPVYGSKSQAAWAVQNARANGIAVIGLGIGGVNEHLMSRVFGDDGYVLGEMDGLSDALIEAYNKQMKVGQADV